MTTDQESEGGSPLEPVPMQPVPPPERRTRAGRNLPAAIGVGLGLGVVIIGTLYVWKPAFVVVVVAAAVLGVWELGHAFAEDRVRVPLVPLSVGAAAIVASAYAGGSEALLVALTLTVLGTCCGARRRTPRATSATSRRAPSPRSTCRSSPASPR